MIGIAINLVFLAFIFIVCYLLYKIPIVNSIIQGIWKKHWEIIIAILVGLFVAYYIMPKFMR